MFGGVLLVVADLVILLVVSFEDFSQGVLSNSYAYVQGLYLLGTVLILGGLVGLYASQVEAAGTLGLVGFVVAFAGTALAVGIFWAETFVVPEAAKVSREFREDEPSNTLILAVTLTFMLVAVGWALFGIATFRARVYRRLLAVLLVIGALLSLFPLSFASMALGLAVALLGFSLFTRKAAISAKQPEGV